MVHIAHVSPGNPFPPSSLLVNGVTQVYYGTL